MACTTCPVFRPSAEEFENFSEYMEKIDPIARPVGLAKVVPPAGWYEARRRDIANLPHVSIPSPLRQCLSGGKGVFQVNILEGPVMSLAQFRAYANAHAEPEPDLEKRVRKFWRGLSCHMDPPLYGADIPGSFFEAGDATSWNVARLDTILQVMGDVPGVTTAMLYVGMWRAMFAYHVEDVNLYSINYIHCGAAKSWYTVAPRDRRRLETLAESLYPEEFRSCPEYLRHKTTMLSPQRLQQAGIPFSECVHNAGEFMITYPCAYHAGFNHGFNVAESANFALDRWLPEGRAANYCRCRPHSVHINLDVMEHLVRRAREMHGDDVSWLSLEGSVVSGAMAMARGRGGCSGGGSGGSAGGDGGSCGKDSSGGDEDGMECDDVDCAGGSSGAADGCGSEATGGAGSSVAMASKRSRQAEANGGGSADGRLSSAMGDGGGSSSGSGSGGGALVKRGRRAGAIGLNGPTAERWVFTCDCGEQCTSDDPPERRTTGLSFECERCGIWCHALCVYDTSDAFRLPDAPLCFHCQYALLPPAPAAATATGAAEAAAAPTGKAAKRAAAAALRALKQRLAWLHKNAEVWVSRGLATVRRATVLAHEEGNVRVHYGGGRHASNDEWLPLWSPRFLTNRDAEARVGGPAALLAITRAHAAAAVAGGTGGTPRKRGTKKGGPAPTAAALVAFTTAPAIDIAAMAAAAAAAAAAASCAAEAAAEATAVAGASTSAGVGMTVHEPSALEPPLKEWQRRRRDGEWEVPQATLRWAALLRPLWSAPAADDDKDDAAAAAVAVANAAATAAAAAGPELSELVTARLLLRAVAEAGDKRVRTLLRHALRVLSLGHARDAAADAVLPLGHIRAAASELMDAAAAAGRIPRFADWRPAQQAFYLGLAPPSTPPPQQFAASAARWYPAAPEPHRLPLQMAVAEYTVNHYGAGCSTVAQQTGLNGAPGAPLPPTASYSGRHGPHQGFGSGGGSAPFAAGMMVPTQAGMHPYASMAVTMQQQHRHQQLQLQLQHRHEQLVLQHEYQHQYRHHHQQQQQRLPLEYGCLSGASAAAMPAAQPAVASSLPSPPTTMLAMPAALPAVQLPLPPPPATPATPAAPPAAPALRPSEPPVAPTMPSWIVLSPPTMPSWIAAAPPALPAEAFVAGAAAGAVAGAAAAEAMWQMPSWTQPNRAGAPPPAAPPAMAPPAARPVQTPWLLKALQPHRSGGPAAFKTPLETAMVAGAAAAAVGLALPSGRLTFATGRAAPAPAAPACPAAAAPGSHAAIGAAPVAPPPSVGPSTAPQQPSAPAPSAPAGSAVQSAKTSRPWAAPQVAEGIEVATAAAAAGGASKEMGGRPAAAAAVGANMGDATGATVAALAATPAITGRLEGGARDTAAVLGYVVAAKDLARARRGIGWGGEYKEPAGGGSSGGGRGGLGASHYARAVTLLKQHQRTIPQWRWD